MRVRFHLPDIMRHFRLNIILLDYLDKHPNMFRDGVEVASVYGCFPNMTWNGGAFIQGNMDVRVIKEVLNQYNRRGAALRFTLTNPLIEMDHLSDKLCGSVLTACDNGLNEAEVCSPLLEDYIRLHFPKMALTSSEDKLLKDFDSISAELEKDYAYVSIHRDLNTDEELLKKLPHREKIMLTPNPRCDKGCTREKDCLDSVGRSQIGCTANALARTGRPYEPEKFICVCNDKNLYETVKSPVHLTPEDIFEKLAPMGFENFKIEGRNISAVNVLEAYIYYMIKPEYADKARLDMLMLLTGGVKFFM